MPHPQEPRSPSRSPPARRLGPRPLPQHLALAMMVWGNSATAWPSLKAAWQNSKAGSNPPEQTPLERALQSLAPELEKADEAALIQALTAEGHKRLERFIDGVTAYRHHGSHRAGREKPAIWREGTTRLRDYRQTVNAKAPRVLVIPSLINRYYILDLEPENSFLADLASRGYSPFVVDWGAPGAEEQRFDLTRYIAGRLEGALDAVKREPGGPIIVIGYCMGGDLALALAQRRQSDIAALALLATPWDFHADGQTQAELIGAIGRQMDSLFQVLGEMPVDVLQSLFASLDPLSILAKFRRFADMPEDGQGKFVALEDWLNDGTGLAAPVARECLQEWYGANATAKGKWRIAGKPVLPEQVSLRALAMVPAADRIVPPRSALGLAQRLPRCEILSPAAGHIGMMAGGSARAKVWEPLDRWLRQIAAS